MKNKHGIKGKLNKMPLWSQLLVLMTVVTTLLISLILVRDYEKNRQSVVEQQVTTARRLLNLEMQNLEQYIRDLASFCMQPIYDTDFYTAITSNMALDGAQKTYIKDQIKTYYYSRTDLNGYEIYFCRQQESFGRRGNAQHVTQLEYSDITQDRGYALTFEGKYYNAIMPSADSKSFFTYYQSIIRIKNRDPAAVVRLDVDTSYAQALNREHRSNEEFICILNADGGLLFSGDTSLVNEESTEAIAQLVQAEDKTSQVVRLADGEYLGVLSCGGNYGLRMVSFLPMRVVEEKISSILRSSIFFGGFCWMLAAAFTWMILRVTMRPLGQLSNQMEKAGEGNFSSATDIGGSREISNLADSFNDMVEHIDNLIRQNYLSEINEKTSRLTALEAQLNPHFLYNTLQAIGTEALINDQPQINRMITSLASNLRYSIKGGDLVRLGSEMTYVKNYILLQKMRLDERLVTEIRIEEAMEDYLVPKISIQTLVENSIIHGMGPEQDFIAIRIFAKIEDGRLFITVKDDGCGIRPEQLDKMQQDFQDFLKPGTAGKIGLANLYSRLQLLYQGEADMEIRSVWQEGTSITMVLPARKSVG